MMVAFFGTLCAIDPNPKELSAPHIKEMFFLYARIIAQGIDSQITSNKYQSSFEQRKRIGALREQLIAIVGHDLRAPLSVCKAGASAFFDKEPHGRFKRIAELMRNSANRMTELIDTLLDFAEAQLGKGLSIKKLSTTQLPAILKNLVEEQQVVFPHVHFNSQISIDREVIVDSARVAQLFSNLLANALVHGRPHKPITVNVHNDLNTVTISIKNSADEISAEKLKSIFEPYERGHSENGGIGLGLFIASTISKSHGGSIEAFYKDGQIEIRAVLNC